MAELCPQRLTVASNSLPDLAKRLDGIEPFHVMEFVKRARELELSGRSIIHMSIGEPDFSAPPEVVAALTRAAAEGETGYTQATGIEPLRRAISAYYESDFGVKVDPARIIVTAGASAALLLACCALVNGGDQVLLADPTYPCNRHFIRAFDGVPQSIAVGSETRFQLTASLVEQNWNAAVKGVLLASPSNPTGTSIPFDELSRIIEVVQRHRGFTMVDEIYLGLQYDGAARSALEISENVVVTSSFSKFFAMTGWRLGWIVVPQDWVAAFEKLAQNLYICASALAQRAALACFTPSSMTVFRARRAEFKERRDYLVPALEELGFQVPVFPDGAFYVYVDCSRWSNDSTAFANELLEGAGVAIVPGMDFGSNQPGRFLRVSYATDLGSLKAAVGRMSEWLSQRPVLGGKS